MLVLAVLIGALTGVLTYSLCALSGLHCRAEERAELERLNNQ